MYNLLHFYLLTTFVMNKWEQQKIREAKINQLKKNGISFLTWKPPSMDSPNQTCFFSALESVHQFFRGIVRGLAFMHVSPVSMLQ